MCRFNYSVFRIGNIFEKNNKMIFSCQIVVVFYVAIVLLLIGTNLRAGGAGRGARFKKHVVEFTEVLI